MKSVIRIKDGSTVLLGGLIRQKSTLSKARVPFLGSIPIVGMLFRHKEDGPRKDREILIFITPRIIRNSADLARIKQRFPGRLNRELDQKTPGDIEKNRAIEQELDLYDNDR